MAGEGNQPQHDKDKNHKISTDDMQLCKDYRQRNLNRGPESWILASNMYIFLTSTAIARPHPPAQDQDHTG